MEAICKKSSMAIFLAMILQLVGLTLFVMGFFPVKSTLKGFSGIKNLNLSCHEMGGEKMKAQEFSIYQEELGIHPQYDRLIFMVIDGLPAEFVIGKEKASPSNEMIEAMPFTHNLLSQGLALGYHARAAPPTVTMPRLKAMTSGAISGFFDVALNFNAQEFSDDNLVGQLAAAGWKMVMYGDETWLRLFPNTFTRHDGVSSFYVKDTVEVDRNVTRHLESELMTEDWDLLVLHYLGLDHVGHLGGRSSPLMPAKLNEMDEIIRQLHTSIISNATTPGCRRTLLTVVSDHGMTDGGNHGGASPQETDALALFAGAEKFSTLLNYSDEVSQVDLAPTLALLLGVPIPLDSVGVLLVDLFSHLTAREKLRALEINSWHLLRLLRLRSPKSSCFASICSNEDLSHSFEEIINDESTPLKFCSLFLRAQKLHQAWSQQNTNTEEHLVSDSPDWRIVYEAYILFLRDSSTWLARGMTERKLNYILAGGFMMLFSLLVPCRTIHSILIATSNLSKASLHTNNGFLLVVVSVGGALIHAASLVSSSFVEEEQFTWYYMASTMCFALLQNTCMEIPSSSLSTLQCSNCANGGNNSTETSKPKGKHSRTTKRRILSLVVVVLIGRVVKEWHRGGVNWAQLPDVSKWLDLVDPWIVLTIRLFSLCLVTITAFVLVRKPRHFLQMIVATNLALGSFLILAYIAWTYNGTQKLSDFWSILFARLVYAVLSATALFTLLVSPWYFSAEGGSNSIIDKETVGLRRNAIDGIYQDCLNFIGRVFIACWSLLQILLQHPANAAPIAMLLLQLLAILYYFNSSRCRHVIWLKFLLLLWIGACGHYQLGNTNTLATVDVAGAYIGLTSHSILLSGLLSLMITYASPILFALGMILVKPTHRISHINEARNGMTLNLLEMAALPCAVLLASNGLELLASTFVMFLMKDHLFVWSVFAPKYLYACASTVCTCLLLFVIMFTSLSASLVICKRIQ